MTTLEAKPVVKAAGGKNPWRRLWQVPALIAGLVIFAYGTRALVRTIKPVSYETHIQDIQGLMAQKQYPKAIEQINTLYEYYKTDAEKLGPLYMLAGDAHFLAQQNEPALVEENYRRAIELWSSSLRLGVKPTVQMKERWGLAALALGRAGEAVEKLEDAIHDDPALMKVHARELTQAYAGSGQVVRALDVVDRMLKVPDLEVGDRVWALTKRIELTMPAGGEPLTKAIGEALKAVPEIPERDPAGRLLAWVGRAEFERGQVDAAQKHLTEARQRMGGSPVLLGNLNPVTVLMDGTPEMVNSGITKCHREAGPRFIVGAGCEVPRGTPEENLRALGEYARTHTPDSQ